MTSWLDQRIPVLGSEAAAPGSSRPAGAYASGSFRTQRPAGRSPSDDRASRHSRSPDRLDERCIMTLEELPEVVDRLDRLDQKVSQLLDLVVRQKTIKDYYTTADVAELTGKAEFTVREYCRLGRIVGTKRACGRGAHASWVISHAELTRYRNEGLLPLRKG